MQLLDRLLAVFGLERRALLDETLRDIHQRRPLSGDAPPVDIPLENARRSWMEAYGTPEQKASLLVIEEKEILKEQKYVF